MIVILSMNFIAVKPFRYNRATEKMVLALMSVLMWYLWGIMRVIWTVCINGGLALRVTDVVNIS